MKFKVGDNVRYTREFLVNVIHTSDECFYTGIEGFEITNITETEVRSKDGISFYENHLELVPEEPEFEYGEMIEVSCDKIQREKRIFLTKINGNAIFPYVCVADYSYDNFINGSVFSTRDRKYARKLRPQLTRKEIAEKFGVRILS